MRLFRTTDNGIGPFSENSELLPDKVEVQGRLAGQWSSTLWAAILGLVAVGSAALLGSSAVISAARRGAADDGDVSGEASSEYAAEGSAWRLPDSGRRCDWVVGLFTERDAGRPREKLRPKYALQSEDANVFYRATAQIFWLDFANGNWSASIFSDIGANGATLQDGEPLGPKQTWTWVTGDQHLSNFGAWRNRHGDVVFSVNDFDEAAIYDFHVDVIRIAVSVCNHAFTNGFSKKEVKAALRAFTDTYVDTVVGYVGNEEANLYEITPETATGALRDFLEDVEEDKSNKKQLKKFTRVDGSGARRFIKNSETKLVKASPRVEGEIRDAFTSERYGATMMKIGWHVHGWDDDYFRVLDVAVRVGSGIGSYGVDRYYVLLKGENGLLGEDGEDGAAVILDVKFEPPPAVSRVLNGDDAAWYDTLFVNEAARAVEAQRRLTSYVDPFTGWVLLDGRAFVVRQRSPWKDSPDLDDLSDPDDFVEFMEQVAVATATSHVRGTASKSPAQFKHVIAAVLGKKAARKAWGKAVSRIARKYREQVLLDFQCFREFVEANYPKEDSK